MLKETNDMRRLMGLSLIKEEMESAGKEDKKESGDLDEMKNYGDHQERDEYDDGESEVIGVDSDIDKQRLQKEGEESLPTIKEMEKCVSEGMTKKQVCEKYSKCDEGKIKEMYDKCKSMNEDSEGEETYNYGEDEGEDHKKEMSMEDHIAAIEDHLKHLKKDMGYDEDHEDRDEEGTHFAEGKKYSSVLNTLTESEYKTLKRFIK